MVLFWKGSYIIIPKCGVLISPVQKITRFNKLFTFFKFARHLIMLTDVEFPYTLLVNKINV